MGKIAGSLLVVVGAFTLILGSEPANAAATCKVVPSWCPPAPGGGDGGSHSVPEPASLAVLAAGAAAAIAARRRKRK